MKKLVLIGLAMIALQACNKKSDNAPAAQPVGGLDSVNPGTPLEGQINGNGVVFGEGSYEIDANNGELRIFLPKAGDPNGCDKFKMGYPNIQYSGPNQTGLSRFDINSGGSPVIVSTLLGDQTTSFIVPQKSELSVDSITESEVVGRLIYDLEGDGTLDIKGSFKAIKCP
jgi:hypothetical protein